MAKVLAERVDQGQYSAEEALQIAETIFYETPQQLLGMEPREVSICRGKNLEPNPRA
jgi:hypothetical protein